MLHSKARDARVLLTTPDYPPQLGGLSTYTKSIERALQLLDVPYDLLVWDSVASLKNNQELRHVYDFGLHVNFWAGYFLRKSIHKNINFLHGSEILFTSPHPLKKLVKTVLKQKVLYYLSQSYFNLAISEFTQKKLFDQGLRSDFGRDFIFHNCINLDDAQFFKKDISQDVLKLCCFARDVPHKNLMAVWDFAKEASLIWNKEVHLYITKDLPMGSRVKVFNTSSYSNEQRDQCYQKCHFNLLLSLDHSHKGFYEGFGLTVLEAAQFGTPSIVSPSGGLPEACHDQEMGWVVEPIAKNIKRFLKDFDFSSYDRVAKSAFEHTLNSHGEEHYQKLFQKILFNSVGQAREQHV